MKKRTKSPGGPAALILLGFLLCVPMLAGVVGNYEYSLGQIGEKAAVFSALLSMPESGLDLLRERFRDQLLPAEPMPAPDTSEAARPKDEPSAPSPSQEPSFSPENLPGSTPAPKVPEQYAQTLLAEDMRGGPDRSLVEFGEGYIKNETKYDTEAVEKMLQGGLPMAFEDTGEPQVLIFHTHATESFEPYDRDKYDTRNTWRSTDNENNMVALGTAFAQVLEQNGIGVIHDATQHDYPSYNGSYNRSLVTIQKYLEEYPTIKVVLDLHRDGIQRDTGEIVKPVAEVNGRKASQIMIIAPCDDGTMGIPNWQENLRFAAGFQNYMEQAAPGLTRPVYLCYRKYNMDQSSGSLLLEFGSQANTLEEGIYAAQLSAQALADLIKDNTESIG